MVDEEMGLGPLVLSRLMEVHHVLYADVLDWLVGVHFHFAEAFLSVEANPDDDTAEVSFVQYLVAASRLYPRRAIGLPTT